MSRMIHCDECSAGDYQRCRILIRSDTLYEPRPKKTIKLFQILRKYETFLQMQGTNSPVSVTGAGTGLLYDEEHYEVIQIWDLVRQKDSNTSPCAT